ncbi:putative aldehyde reductase II [Xylona heveae TC161]|uniref:Putative aldehyde reductase II n=1 Tax=Xylona heveae (strain CBS 132557 / TC161) TaxID=1328760 RepID=A0A165IH75_XYLHT|nr:putative aldehyde reductase II [Xylona heveae TC161]KZF24892.1 putative aldehyde reductase II [Xylona heveae TC161]
MVAGSSSIVPPGGRILITGVNGFLASHLALVLLKRGYGVRGTVRSADKADWIKAAISQRELGDRFEVEVVPDLSVAGALDDLVQDVDGIAHVAADTTFGCDPNKIITPLVEAMRNILTSASKAQSIQRFVLTSSAMSAISPQPGKKIFVDSNTWNDASLEPAWAPPPYEPERAWDVYAALKMTCEREFWRFGQEQGVSFVRNSVLPDFIIGPLLYAKQTGSSNRLVKEFFDDPNVSEPLRTFIPRQYVDVKDVALLHMAALTEEDVKNERLLAHAGPFNFNSWLSAFRQIDPSKAWPADDPNQQHDCSIIDTRRSEEILKRYGQIGFTPFLDSVRSNCLDSHPEWKRS